MAKWPSGGTRNFYGVVLTSDVDKGRTKSGRTKREITWFDPETSDYYTANGYGSNLYMASTSGGIHADHTQYVDIVRDGRGTVILIRKSEGM